MDVSKTKLHVNAGGMTYSCRSAMYRQDLAETRRGGTPAEPAVPLWLEYAIRRTCSASLVGERLTRRPSAVWTTWLPVAETPHTRARSVENALLSMDSHRRGYVSGLASFVAGWKLVFEGQAAVAARLPEAFRPTADGGWLMRPKGSAALPQFMNR